MRAQTSRTEEGFEMAGAEGRVGVITGAGSGIGRATAELWAAAGGIVVVADRDELKGAETVSAIEKEGGQASFVPVDVGEEDSIIAMIETVVDRHGRIDAAMNNAGISDDQHSWIDFPTDRWERMIKINLGSVFLGMKHELAQMAKQEPIGILRGAIVNTSSGAGMIPAPGQPHYTAAKHGVLGLTRSAAQEFASQGIRVNSICPGLTETNLIGNQPPELIQMMERMSPTGKLGQAVDVAQAAYWLLTPEAQWVNGQAIVVDGGGVMH
jgi:NAD(P)-dependent dehydrogenase (short-subunit alcohol dehydrogenase family)